MDWSTFKDEAEGKAYVEDEIKAATDTSYPTLEHKSNWRLTKYYFKEDRGIAKSEKVRVSDSLDRQSTDVSGAMAMLGCSVDCKPKKFVSLQDKHRLGVEKV